MSYDRNLLAFKTALGWAGVAATEQGICRVVLPKKDKVDVERALCNSEFPRLGRSRAGFVPSGGEGCPANARVLKKAVQALQKYFSGESVLFDLPLDLGYYTSFQQAVWHVTAKIPFGETRSYRWISLQIRNPRAVRAVGQALGANPVPVIVPCHRVISASGAMGGFSGGIGMKEKLLELEKGKPVVRQTTSGSKRHKHK